MLTFVTWKWATPGYRTTFTADHVNTLGRMLQRHYHAPHRVLCVTDDAAGLDAEIEAIPLWPNLASLPSPHGPQHPSCYRRLKAFSADIGETFGDRFVSLDLDCVITGDVTALFDRDDDFVIWRDPIYARQVNASMFLLRAGSRTDVWTQFNPLHSPRRATQAGFRGSDQAWISYCGRPSATWTKLDGVFSYRVDLQDGQDLPAHATVVLFHGGEKPWSADASGLPWVTQWYQ